MSTFTKGPWTLLPCSHGGMILKRGEGLLEHQQPFLQILPSEDARLISAAPEMYEALKAVAAYSGETDLHKPFGGILHLVRAALAKAEGREG